MKQRCHTWIALRAVDLISNDPDTKELSSVLIPRSKYSSIGCWLPDMNDFKKGHGITGHHTFKIAPYYDDDKDRFIVSKEKLLKALNHNFALYDYLKKDKKLDDHWWEQPYKAIQNEGEHLPSCISSVFDTIADMLLLADEDLDQLVPGDTSYDKYLKNSCAISKEQVSTFFFMISHYIADCFMPCHADKRKMCSYKYGGIHEGWERYLDNEIGVYFDKTKLLKTIDTSEEIIKKTKELDRVFGLIFNLPLTWGNNKDDIWETAVLWCRGSFSFSSILFPLDKYPYNGLEESEFDEYFMDSMQLKEYSRIILQSAVYAVASTWKQVWLKFK